jgi:MFS family permease
MLTFLLPIYAKHLGASALEIGGLFAIFALMTVLVRPMVGWALDRFGRKGFFVGGLVGYAGAMGLFAVARDVTVLYLARLVQGISASLLWISAYTIATELTSPEGRGRAVGQVDEARARGALAGALVGFTLLGMLSGLRGWSVLFAGYAALAATGAWLAWKDIPATHPRQLVPGDGGRIAFRPLVKLMVVVFIAGLSAAMLSPLLLIFLQDKFTTDIGLLALAFLPAALVHSLLPSRLGRLSDRFGRPPLMALGLLGSGLVSLLMPDLPHLGWLIGLWVVEAVGEATAAPATEALVADLTGRELRGRGYGLYTLVAGLGATAGPLLGGWVYDAVGHAAPFYVNGGVLLASAVWVLLVLGRRPHGNAFEPTREVYRPR